MKDVLIIASANVAGREEDGFAYRARVAKKVFADVDAHIIGFQEFAEKNLPCFERQGLVFLLGEPANGVYNAIAYDPKRVACDLHEHLWLTEDGKPGKGWGGLAERAAQWALFRDKCNGSKLVFVNAQFDNASDEARLEGMRLVLAFFERQSLPAQQVLLGDLNMSVGRKSDIWTPERMEPYRLALAAGFKDAWLESKPQRPRARTFHHFQGPGCGEDAYQTFDPDYMLVKGMHVHNSMLVTDSYGGVMPSDHYWLVTHAGLQE